MDFNKDTQVQCFYNVTFNIGHEFGKSKFQWGFRKFFLHDDDQPLLGQIVQHLPFKESEVFNVNLTAFTPFPDSVFENADNADEEQPHKELK